MRHYAVLVAALLCCAAAPSTRQLPPTKCEWVHLDFQLPKTAPFTAIMDMSGRWWVSDWRALEKLHETGAPKGDALACFVRELWLSREAIVKANSGVKPNFECQPLDRAALNADPIAVRCGAR